MFDKPGKGSRTQSQAPAAPGPSDSAPTASPGNPAVDAYTMAIGQFLSEDPQLEYRVLDLARNIQPQARPGIRTENALTQGN